MRFARFRPAGILLSALLAVFLLWAVYSAPVFEMGSAYELYTGTSSAEIIRTDMPALAKLCRTDIRGESVRYEGDCAARLLEKFHAEVCFSEEAAGVVNYYCYSPALGHGILLNGHLINLHIAVGAEYTAAGTPLIFGGY